MSAERACSAKARCRAKLPGAMPSISVRAAVKTGPHYGACVIAATARRTISSDGSRK
jgi:hypothetical protein